jgi:hypothetical protein
MIVPIMRAWPTRILATSLPWLLLGCPNDETTATGDDDGSTTNVTDGSTSAPSTSGRTTTEGPATTTPGTDTGMTSLTTGPMTTSEDESSTGQPPPPPVCGNNVIEGDEVCDLTQVNNETCASLGYEGGVLGCLLDCTDYNLNGCFICGNDIVDMMEDCENEVPKGVDCESLGFEAGTLACGDDCLYDTSECSICGDGIASGPEQCDGLDLDGETCQSLGFTDGFLGCNLAACAFDYSACSGGMYLQNFEGLANIPPEFTVDAGNPWEVDDTMPINGLQSARAQYPAGVGGQTNLTLDAQFPAAGSISFDYETSCANGIDYLQFYMDGALQQQWTGIVAAANHNQAVPAGVHTFQWRFSRDGFIDKGQNAVWVDDVALVGGVPQ